MRAALTAACTALGIEPANFLSLAQPAWYALTVHRTRSSQGVTVSTPPFQAAVLKFLQVEHSKIKRRKQIDVANKDTLIDLFAPPRAGGPASGAERMTSENEAYPLNRAKIQVKLLDIFLDSYLDSRVAGAAHTQVLEALSSAMQRITRLATTVATRSRTALASESGSEAVIVQIIGALDQELLYLSDGAASARYNSAVFKPGLSAVGLLELLEKEGANLRIEPALIVTKFKDVLRDAKARDFHADLERREGNQEAVDYLANTFANVYNPITDLDELRQRLKDDMRACAVLTRADAGKRARGAFAAQEEQQPQYLQPPTWQQPGSPQQQLPPAGPQGQQPPPAPPSGAPASPSARAEAHVNAMMAVLGPSGTQAEINGFKMPYAVADTRTAVLCCALAVRSKNGPYANPIPGPLDVHKIIASGLLPELQGVVPCPPVNTRREDGRYGLDCSICVALSPRPFKTEATWAAFEAEFPKGITDPAKLALKRECIVVHYQPHCRALRQLVATAVQRDSSLAWMAVTMPAKEFMGSINAGARGHREERL